MPRLLTLKEVSLLQPVFGNTIRYHSILCDSNKANIGGEGNSITPAGLAYISQKVYVDDFGAEDAEAYAQWVFVHEIGHVWQWQHGRYPVNEAIGTWISHLGRYTQAYPYELTPGKDLMEYNFEQQASIIADYWALLTRKLRPQYNTSQGEQKLGDYSELIASVRSSGRPYSHLQATPL